jgi:hypothetical protein
MSLFCTLLYRFQKRRVPLNHRLSAYLYLKELRADLTPNFPALSDCNLAEDIRDLAQRPGLLIAVGKEEFAVLVEPKEPGP